MPTQIVMNNLTIYAETWYVRAGKGCTGWGRKHHQEFCFGQIDLFLPHQTGSSNRLFNQWKIPEPVSFALFFFFIQQLEALAELSSRWF